MNPISQQRLKEILDYDPQTGHFYWKEKIADKVNIGSIAGSSGDRGVVHITLFKKRYKAHRLAFLWMTGSIPTQVDHIDHNPANNEWKNLRPACYKSNGKNHPKTKRNSTGVVGVSKTPSGNYIARIYAKGKHINLGTYKTLEEAAQARAAANITYDFHPNHGK